MRQYLDLVDDVLTHGKIRQTSGGFKTIASGPQMVKYDLTDGFPLLTTKEMNFEHQVNELLWYLSGERTLDALQERGMKYWDPWATLLNEVPSPYGYFWRHYPAPNHSKIHMTEENEVDQIKVVEGLLRRDPFTRRAVITSWYPPNALYSNLPPCHILFRLDFDGERLNAELYQRSADIPIGVPYNVAQYALLLKLFALSLRVKPGVLTHFMGNPHIYVNQIPAVKEQLKREPKPLPSVNVRGPKSVQNYTWEDEDRFYITNYDPHPAIRFPVTVV